MQGLTNLVPNTTQDLLETCTSVKVKRLFSTLQKNQDTIGSTGLIPTA
jgi:hypothetical protein